MTDMPWAKLPRWIVLEGTLAHLTHAEVKTLMIIVTITDQHGLASPSNRMIAEAAGVGEQSVRRAIKTLKDHECIELTEPSSGRKPATYRVPTDRRPVTHDRLKPLVDRSPTTGQAKPVTHDRSPTTGLQPVDRSPTTGQAKPVTHDRSPTTGLQPVDRSPTTGLRTHIGTRAKKKEERENIYLSPLPDYAVELFTESFPAGLIKTNWSSASFDTLRSQITNQRMTTHWQIRRCIQKLAGVQGRKFPVPNPPEVFEAFRAVEAANKKRSKFFERAVKNHLTTENLAQYQAIVDGLDPASLTELFERTQAFAASESNPDAIKLTWDMSIPSLQRNAYTDLQIDPESNQWAARGLRCWVIIAHNKAKGVAS